MICLTKRIEFLSGEGFHPVDYSGKASVLNLNDGLGNRQSLGNLSAIGNRHAVLNCNLQMQGAKIGWSSLFQTRGWWEHYQISGSQGEGKLCATPRRD